MLNSVRKETTYIKITVDGDTLLELAAVWGKLKKQEVVENLARCPLCGLLLLDAGPGWAYCPQCKRFQFFCRFFHCQRLAMKRG